MLNWILPFIKDAELRAVPPYQLFLKSQHGFIHEQYKRLSKQLGHESAGIALLRYILNFVDMDYLNRCRNNYDRYRYHIRFIYDNLTDIFDRAARGTGYHQLFFAKNDFLTEEYLLPTEDLNNITLLPFDDDSWTAWRTVRPLCLWSHDSTEFTTNLLNDRIKYSYLPPSYAVFLLNVTALIFKYYTWYRTQRLLEPAQDLVLAVPQQYFLHKYVCCDLLWDLANSWLLNLFVKLNQTPAEDLTDFAAANLQYDATYGRIALNSEAGFSEIWKLLHNVKRNLRPEALCSSTLLYGGSINQKIRSSAELWDISPLRRYDWLRWLRDRDLFLFFIQVQLSRPDLPTTKTILRTVNREMGRLLRQRPWNNCNNTQLKIDIENDIGRVAAYLASGVR